MNEAKLEIYENESKGKVYKNIALKTKVDRNTNQVTMQGLENDEFIIVEKSAFAEGRKCASGIGQNGKPWAMYSCAVKYNGDDVSFILYEQDHDVYKNCGGVGDKVKISLKEETLRLATGKRVIEKLNFELA